ncbi:MAG TPA: peptidoglycan DD-metalloendopeptidase family protein [Myxococcales bacterium]|jgi:septal ring factor EnvC (AmiA/AmiB activator)
MRRAALLSALVLCLAAPRAVRAAAEEGQAPPPQPPPAQSAEEVAQQVQAQEEALSKLREHATSVLDSLQLAEDEVRALQDAAAQAEASARAANARVAAAQKEEDKARDALVAELEELAPRLKVRYELGKQRRTNLLVTADSIGDLLWRQRALDQVLAGDLKLVGKARSALDALEAKRTKLEAVKADYSQRSQFAAGQRAKATRRKDELVGLHDSLMEQQDLKEKMLKELKQVQSELTKYVKHLPQALAELKPAAKDGFAKRKGKMPYPAKGHIEVAFGKVLNPKFNTVTFQKGLDLRASEGSEVAAVADGKVVHAGAFRGYGNLVIVDHGDGYHTLYAHLATLAKAVGDEVEGGQALGTVGDTGSLKGAYLYFEVREKGKPVDPKEWLGAP